MSVRKRRWDVVDPEQAKKTLAAKAQQLAGLSAHPNDVNSDTAEIIINDAPPNVRYVLTKSSNHDHIYKQTGAVVTTRGIYVTPGEPINPLERPLYLSIAAKSREPVQRAESLIREIMAGTLHLMSSGELSCQVPVPMTPHPSFNLSARLMGINGEFFKHISTKTGAKLQLKGFGYNSTEPLHIYILADTLPGIQEARSLAQDLVSTVKAKYDSIFKSDPGNTHQHPSLLVHQVSSTYGYTSQPSPPSQSSTPSPVGLVTSQICVNSLHSLTQSLVPGHLSGSHSMVSLPSLAPPVGHLYLNGGSAGAGPVSVATGGSAVGGNGGGMVSDIPNLRLQQTRGSLTGSLNGQSASHLTNQLTNQLTRGLINPLSTQQQLTSQLTGQLTGQHQLTSQLMGQLTNPQLTNQQLTNQQLTNQQLTNQQLNSQLTSQLTDPLTNSLTSHLKNQLTNQLANQLMSQLTNQLTTQLTNQATGIQPSSPTGRMGSSGLVSGSRVFEDAGTLTSSSKRRQFQEESYETRGNEDLVPSGPSRSVKLSQTSTPTNNSSQRSLTPPHLLHSPQSQHSLQPPSLSKVQTQFQLQAQNPSPLQPLIPQQSQPHPQQQPPSSSPQPPPQQQQSPRLQPPQNHSELTMDPQLQPRLQLQQSQNLGKYQVPKRRRFQEMDGPLHGDQGGGREDYEEAILQRLILEEKARQDRILMPPPPLDIVKVLKKKKKDSNVVTSGPFKLVAYDGEDGEEEEEKEKPKSLPVEQSSKDQFPFWAAPKKEGINNKKRHGRNNHPNSYSSRGGNYK
eukprot:TRINITY_DN6935_c0_g3_i7.p1 TRINITY_DN6935_c0_g3~~TRINITY_DN6935_c0_g3_i7.p1  ORF type:complete len:789 (-),score=182.32 TRINITY_DN6935_c0_g3_i7:332-2698(-)